MLARAHSRNSAASRPHSATPAPWTTPSLQRRVSFRCRGRREVLVSVLRTQRHRGPQGRRRPVRRRALSAAPVLLVRRVRRCPEWRSSWRVAPLGPDLLGFWALVRGLILALSTSPVASAVVTMSAHAPRPANAQFAMRRNNVSRLGRLATRWLLASDWVGQRRRAGRFPQGTPRPSSPAENPKPSRGNRAAQGFSRPEESRAASNGNAQRDPERRRAPLRRLVIVAGHARTWRFHELEELAAQGEGTGR